MEHLQPATITDVDAQPPSPYQATLPSRSYPEEEHLVHFDLLEQQQPVRRRRRAAQRPAPQEPTDNTAARRRQRTTAAAAHRIDRRQQQGTQRDTSSQNGSCKLSRHRELGQRRQLIGGVAETKEAAGEASAVAG